MGAVAVTGAAAGLGLLIGEALAAEGRTLVLVDRDEGALEEAASRLRQRGAQVTTLRADLSDLDAARDVAGRLAALEVAALVNNAGAWSPHEQFPDAAEPEWLASMTLNLLAPMLLTQRLWPGLAAADGAVVNVGSSGGEGDGAYGSPEYGAAKAGLRRFTASLGERPEVRVTAVVPGWIGLERAHAQLAALSPAEQEAQGPLIPPADVVTAVLHLLREGRPGEIVEIL